MALSNHSPGVLTFDKVVRRYGASGEVVAVGGIDCTITEGSFVALVGASGSGKSTLLKMVNTLITPSEGCVLFNGEDVTTLKPSQLRRRVGYVFQGIGLFPHFTVGENIAIGPKLAGETLPDARIAELLTLVELEPDMAERMPDELSGGQRQRVGVARALAGDPELLLMDEPFGALDPVTRDALGEKVRELHERLGLTTIMVTHDMAEALLLADRVLVMDSGQLQADCTPHQLLKGEGGEIAQGLVSVPRHQAERLAAMEAGAPGAVKA
ncbi:ATP-binding cassette domain-containing protein [Erythrobacter insulae]|uniref:ATP-binding cassette domain-containing protein n=1 Tax=Erythrobacter insulae TaxID=2584124 RepID=A0A547PAJ7_9SPHN|nr:ATP-binding cassette domain-containing protein [Erythrobacter insulae]TRD11166.1 ATP-binding cassette domain-containing protein [Erythrobacter insulae]